jgi:hypothetical protein
MAMLNMFPKLELVPITMYFMMLAKLRRGMSQKASDLSRLPMTREEHCECHQHGKRRNRVSFAREVRRLNAE